MFGLKNTMTKIFHRCDDKCCTTDIYGLCQSCFESNTLIVDPKKILCNKCVSKD